MTEGKAGMTEGKAGMTEGKAGMMEKKVRMMEGKARMTFFLVIPENFCKKFVRNLTAVSIKYLPYFLI